MKLLCGECFELYSPDSNVSMCFKNSVIELDQEKFNKFLEYYPGLNGEIQEE